jgi:hypothetical protein
MKNYHKILKFIILLSFTACKKNTESYQGTSSLIIANAVIGSSPLITNFSPISGKADSGPFGLYSSAYPISYGSFGEFSSYSGNTSLTLVQAVDTNSFLWRGSFTFQIGGIYSFFLFGDTSKIDTLLVKDSPIVFSTEDSSFGVRFANLCSASQPIEVDISGQMPGSEVSSLVYKGITGFKTYSANADAPASYTFEFRYVSTGQLVGPNASYTFNDILAGIGANTDNNNYRYRNFTLALIGDTSNSGNGVSVVLINNY